MPFIQKIEQVFVTSLLASDLSINLCFLSSHYFAFVDLRSTGFVASLFIILAFYQLGWPAWMFLVSVSFPASLFPFLVNLSGYQPLFHSFFCFVVSSVGFKNEMTVIPTGFSVRLSQLFLGFIKSKSLVKVWVAMCLKRGFFQKVENVEETQDLSLLDLPELALENILGRLPPASLCSTAGVCTDLRRRCRSDHLWELHVKEKWDKVVGPAARQKWQWTVAMLKDGVNLDRGKYKSWFRSWSCIWPFSWLNSHLDANRKLKSNSHGNSLMAWYSALESGNFWFPAQVYNREHGHVGFMLSCYDAELSYDRQANTFHARYPPHGPRTAAIEEGVKWERIRAPPVDTLAHDLHVSDCLDALRPGDHVEVQWRRNKEFPYGWWYGVVGHSDLCDGDTRHCQCHLDGTLWLEFNQYTPGSRWRRAAINRKNHREEGSEAEGFYGGIRKLLTKEEILTWKRLWPKETLE